MESKPDENSINDINTLSLPDRTKHVKLKKFAFWIGLLVSINPLKENVKISVVDTIFISILSSIMLTGIVVFLIWLTNKDKSNKTQFYNECTRKIEERFS